MSDYLLHRSNSRVFIREKIDKGKKMWFISYLASKALTRYWDIWTKSKFR